MMNILAFIRDFAFKDSDSPFRYVSLRSFMELVYCTQLPSTFEQQALKVILEQNMSLNSTKPGYNYFPTQLQQYQLPATIFKQRHQTLNRTSDLNAILSFIKTNNDVDSATAQFEDGVAQSQDATLRNISVFEALRGLSTALVTTYPEYFFVETSQHLSTVIKKPAANIRQRPGGLKPLSKPMVSILVPPIKSLAPPRPKDRAAAAQASLISNFVKVVSVSSNSGTLLELLYNHIPGLSSSERLTSRRQNLEANLPPHFVSFLLGEFSKFQSYLTAVHSTLKDLKAATVHEHLVTEELQAFVSALSSNRTPAAWKSFFNVTGDWPLNAWLEHVINCSNDWEKLSSPNTKACSYSIGMFTNPSGFLACLQRSYMSGPEPPTDLVLQVDITARDREILREPASDGVFLHGVAVINAASEFGELKEPTPGLKSSLPILQLRYVKRDQAASSSVGENEEENVKRRAFACQCFTGDIAEPLFSLRFASTDAVQVGQWALAGVRAVTF